MIFLSFRVKVAGMVWDELKATLLVQKINAIMTIEMMISNHLGSAENPDDWALIKIIETLSTLEKHFVSNRKLDSQKPQKLLHFKQ